MIDIDDYVTNRQCCSQDIIFTDKTRHRTRVQDTRHHKIFNTRQDIRHAPSRQDKTQDMMHAPRQDTRQDIKYLIQKIKKVITRVVYIHTKTALFVLTILNIHCNKIIAKY